MATGVSFTHFAAQKVGESLLRGAAFTPPTQLYLALFTAGPLEDGTGTEVTGGGYTRVGVTFGAPYTTVGTGDFWNSPTEIDFPTATADWGTVSGLALYDAPTGGTMWLYATYATSISVGTGSQFAILATDLYVLID